VAGVQIVGASLPVASLLFKGQSEPAPMTAPVGHSVHRMGLDDSPIFHSPLYLTLTNSLPLSILFGLLTFDHCFFHCQFFSQP